MAINNGQTQYVKATRNYVNLTGFKGSGETGFSKNVTGILEGIEKRDGFYEWDNNGVTERHPNTWTAYFTNGQMFSWPTYEDRNDLDENGQPKVKMWSRFSEDIDLGECIEKRIMLHVWRDERNWTHLEIAKPAQQQQSQQQPAPQPQLQPAPQQYYAQPQQQYYQPQSAPQQYYAQPQQPQYYAQPQQYQQQVEEPMPF